MLASTESMSLLVILNVVFAIIALAVGFIGGVWLSSSRRKGYFQDLNSGEAKERALQEQLERERATMATDRLRDLAGDVASDVGEHSSKMGEITSKLQALDVADVEATGAGLVTALSAIVTANEALQRKLARAEKQIEAQAREINLHESQARTDSLTGIANRRAFDDEMARRGSEVARKGTPLSLIIMDIDFFKNFNDTHGHQAGDEVLRSVGKKLTETCRGMDLPCRYGGEEFAVVMPSTDLANAKPGAERIRSAIEKMIVEFQGKQLEVTTSIGLAQIAPGEQVAHVLKRADDALYESKAAGRNCGHWHDGEKCRPFSDSPEQISQPNDMPIATPTLDALPNRTIFADELRRRMAESSRSEQPVSVMVVELSNYEDLCTISGVEIGCAALNAVASVVENSLREMDLFARLNENSFVTLLPNNSIESAEIVRSRTLAAFEAYPLTIGNDSPDLAINAGIAQFQTGDSVEDIVGRAEAALAAAALAGNDTVPLASTSK